MESGKSKFNIDLKKLKKYSWIILILIPLFLSVYFRMQSAYLPVMDEFAASNVVENVKAQIVNEILSESPNLPPQTLEREVNRRLQTELATNAEEFDLAVKELAGRFREKLQDEDGQTYLLAIDPYTYYRQTKNVLEKGHVGDIIVNGKSYNNHMIAPLGQAYPASLHPYFSAFLYKIISPLTGKSLMGIFSLVPVIVACLAVIPAFFIGKKFAGDFGGFISSLLVGIHAAFINRTAAGFSDTDAYNVTFPLFIAWLFIEAMQAKDLKMKIIYASLSALLTGIFSYAWIGWGFIFDIIIATFLVYIAYHVIVNFKTIIKEKFKSQVLRDSIIVFAIFFILSFIFVSVFIGYAGFIGGAFERTLSFGQYKAVATKTIWPNVYTTVAEQNYAPFPEVVNTMGGKLLFILSLMGIIFSVIKKKIKTPEIIMLSISFFWYLIFVIRAPDNVWFMISIVIPVIGIFAYYLWKQEPSSKLAILIFIWLLATLFASRQGIRFTLILVPAFSIGVGIYLGKIYYIISEWLTKSLNIPRTASSVIVIFLLMLFMVVPVTAGWKTAISEIPSMDDAWWEALTFIKENSTDDDYQDAKWNGAIINSWWDFGHWFKAVADRAVTFDGASQNTPMAHWIGKVLLTGNEDEAVGILRMLDCGSNQAFEKLDSVLNKSPKSVDILYEILVQDKISAKNTLLGYGLTDGQAVEILENTHCEPPENYFITSEDMVGKSGVWAHFGSWDFYRAEMYMRVKDIRKTEGVKILMEDYSQTEEEATKIYYDIQTEEANQWIAPWPSYAQSIRCQEESGKVNCGGIIIDLTTKSVSLPKNIDIEISEVIYETESGLKSIQVSEKGELSIGILSGGKSAMLMAPELTHSMFNILFYYNGEGLKHFDLVKHTTTLTGQEIYVWKVDWNGK